MKKYRFNGGLFATLPLISKNYSYLTNNVKNTSPLEQAKRAQAQLLAIHTTPGKKYKRTISGLLGLLGEGIKALFDSSDFLTGLQVCF